MQNLIQKYKPKLKELLKNYPHIAISFQDYAFALSLKEILIKLGFKVHLQKEQKVGHLTQNIALWLKNKNLVLLHYSAQTGQFSMVNLLRAVKTLSPNFSFCSLVPVIMSAYTSKRQAETFKLLSAFDIQYISMLTSGVQVQQNIEEVLIDLLKITNQFELKSAENRKVATEKIDVDCEKVDKYKELLAKGEELMQQKKYEEAIKYFSEAIDLNPDFEVLIDRGDAFYKVRKYLPALFDFKEANKLEKAIPDVYAKITVCSFNLVKENMKNKEPGKAKKWFKLGLKNLEMAENIIDKMVKANQSFPEKLSQVPYGPVVMALAETDIRGLGLTEIEEEVKSLSLRIIEKADFIDYMDSDVNICERLDYSIFLTRNGKYDEAEKILRQVIHEDLSLAGPVFNNFAIELRKNSSIDRAYQIYLELISFDIPDKDIVIENFRTTGLKYAETLREHFKQDEAVEVYINILKHNFKGKEWILCDLAMTYLEIQNQAEASSKLMEAVYKNPRLMQLEKFKKSYSDLTNLKEEMIKKLSDNAL